MARYALITGSTSGIGAAFARQLASEGYYPVLVARNEDRLKEQAAELTRNYGVTCETLSADLAEPDGLSRVEERIGSIDKPIDFLVNNAGYGMKGDFVAVDADEHERMLRVNALAVLRLLHAALRSMTPRQTGDIINVSSVAGFTPGIRPSSTYGATKAFVTALTEGLTHLIDKRGVHVSAVCPGYVRTEFHDRAGINMTRLPGLFWLRADDVARTALSDHRKGLSISVPSRFYKFIVFAVRVLPRSIYRRIGKIVKNRTNDEA